MRIQNAIIACRIDVHQTAAKLLSRAWRQCDSKHCVTDFLMSFIEALKKFMLRRARGTNFNRGHCVIDLLMCFIEAMKKLMLSPRALGLRAPRFALGRGWLAAHLVCHGASNVHSGRVRAA
jgi:hypothetical protein